MTQKTLWILVVAVFLTAVLSGCTGKEATVDTYYCEVDDGILYLSSDNTYELLIDEQSGGGGMYGNYTNRENKILIKRAFIGDIIVFIQHDPNLIDPDGDRWVLQKL